MFFPKLQQFSNIEGLGYQARSTTKLQAGLVYQSVTIDTNLVSPSTLTKMAIDVNGTEIVYASGETLRDFDKYRKTHYAAGKFTLDFARFDFKTLLGIRIKELVTKPTDNVTLVTEFASKDASDPATLTMRVNAQVTDLQSDRFFIPSMFKFIRNIPGSGEQELIYPQSAPNRMIQCLMFDTSTVDFTRFQIFRGDKRIYEGTKADIEYIQKRYGNRLPQANRFFFEPTLFGLGKDGAFNTGRPDTLIFKLDCTAAGQLPVYVEGYEQEKPLPVAK